MAALLARRQLGRIGCKERRRTCATGANHGASSASIDGIGPTSTFQSVQLAGISDRLPSGRTVRRYRMPRRLMVLITDNARP